MNQKLLTALLVVTFVAGSFISIAADYTTSKNNVVSINPFDFIDSWFNVQLEHKMGPKNSFTAKVGFWALTEYTSIISIGGTYKWYVDPFEEGKSALNGLSVGPAINVFWWSYDYSDVIHGFKAESTVTVNIGAEVAYKWVFGDGKWAVEPTLNFLFPVRKADSGWGSLRGYGYGVNIGYCF